MSKFGIIVGAFLALFAASMLPACAVDTGLFVRPGTGSIPSPVTNKTYLLDTNAPSLKYWNGSSWITQTPPYYNLAGSGAPTVNDDSADGYALGSLYYDTVGGIFYYCTNPALGAAVWIVAAANIPVPVPINKGGTGQIVRASGFNALAPDTALGGLIVGSGTNTYANLGIGAANYLIASQGGTTVWAPLTNGTGITVTGLQVALNIPVSIANGGSNNASLTVAAGGMISTDGSKMQNIGAGNAFQMAMSNGSSQPSWGYSWSGSQAITALNTTLTSASPTLNTIDNTSNANNITLPAAGSVPNQVLCFIHTVGTAGGNAITISRAGSDTIEGATSLTLNAASLYGMLVVQSDGTGVWKILQYLPSMTQGSIFYADANNRMAALPPTTAGFVLSTNGAGANPSFVAAGTGTVTSVSITPTAIFDIATATSTPAITMDNQNANIVLAGPSSGGAATPTFRALVAADLPAGVGFGGNGTSSAVSISTSSVTTPTQYNATTWTTVAANTLTYTGPTALIVNATSTFANPGTITLNGTGGAGAPAGGGGFQHGGDGGGPGGGSGMHAAGQAQGGGGGGFGGRGGSGGDAFTNTQKGCPGGAVYGSWNNGGSGGGAGMGDGTAGNGGAGGAGGGGLFVCAVGAVTNAGTINNTGVAGSNAGTGNAGGGAGGSGGLVYMASIVSCDNAGTITVAGAAGGNANTSGGGGGGGGGGRIIRHSPSNTGAGTFTVSGGSGGTGASAGGAGASGSSGVASTITGTPSLPLVSWMKEGGGLDYLAGLEQIKIALGDASPMKTGGFAVDTLQPTMSWGAAKNNVAKFCYFNNGPTPINDGVLCQDGKEEAALTAGELEAWKDAS